MLNIIAQGDRVELTAPSGGVVSGQGYIINEMFVVAVASALEGEKFAALVEGVVKLPLATATALAEGEKVGWDEAVDNGVVVTDGDAAVDIAIGTAVQALSAAAGQEILVKLGARP